MRQGLIWRSMASLAVAAVLVGACGPGATQSPAGSVAATAGGSAPAASGGSPAAASFGQIGGTVSVYGTWTGAEQDSFMAMIQPWKDATGVTVNYTGQRDLGTAL